MSEEGAVRVAVRVRPFNSRETKMNSKCIIEMHNKQTWLTNPEKPDDIKKFTYDHSYWSFDKDDRNFTDQEQVYKDLGGDVLKAAFDGYNACVFAYGQTGAGKSYTMMGYGEDTGLIPRICEDIFARAAENADQDTKYSATVSYLEIYNENVRDLLLVSGKKSKGNLRVREHPKTGPFVDGLSVHTVGSFEEIDKLMELGNDNRTTAATNMNDTSSRSHAIFTLQFHQASMVEGVPAEKTSKINLVDLAGSERTSATGATGVRLREGGNINKSLTTLGLCISALADRSSKKKGSKGTFIPYRDSVLTWLLRESLGGNSKTIMVAAISPASVNYGETLSTLHYANRAKNIVNKPIVNEDENVRLIKELRAEVERLKSLLGGDEEIAKLEARAKAAKEKLDSATTDEERAAAQAELDAADSQLQKAQSDDKAALAAQLAQSQQMMTALTNTWKSKFDSMTQIMENRSLALRESGRAVRVESEQPHFVSLNLDDVYSTGVTLYYLSEGITTIGRTQGRASYDFDDDEDEPEIIDDDDDDDDDTDNPVGDVEPDEEGEAAADELAQDDGDKEDSVSEPAEADESSAADEVEAVAADTEDAEDTAAESAQESGDEAQEATDHDDGNQEGESVAETISKHVDIALVEDDIEPLHCVVHYDGEEKVTLRPGSDTALITVNGERVTEEIELNQGFTVQLGFNVMFRFNHPVQAKRLREMRSSGRSTPMHTAKAPSKLLSAKLREDAEKIKMTEEKLKELEMAAREREEQQRLRDLEIQEQEEKRRRLEEERQQAEVEQQKRLEEERQKTEETIRRLEEERKRREEELNMLAEQERARRAALEEQLQQERLRMQEETRLAEEERKRLEEETQSKILEEQRRLAEEDRARQEELDRLTRESEAAAKRTEEEAQRLKEEYERKLAAKREAEENEAQRMLAEEQRRVQAQQQELKHKEAMFHDAQERARRHEKTFGDVWEISIPKYMQRGDHFVYQIDMSLDGQKWSIWRRYSQFERLHKQLRSRIPMVAHYVKLPPKVKFSVKSLMHKNNKQFLEERRARLEEYLIEIISKSFKLPNSPFFNVDRSSLEKTVPFFALGSAV